MKALLLATRSLAICLIAASGANAQSVMYFNNESAWLSAVGAEGAGLEALTTSAANVALSAEVASSPATNAAIGPKLTFIQGDTHLSIAFRLKAVNVDPTIANRSIVFDDNENGFPIGQRILSIGDIDGVPGFPATTSLYQNDDFEVEMFAGCPVYAFAVTVISNEYTTGEALRVYGVGNVLLQTFTSGLPDNNSPSVPLFMGVVSDVPITRVAFNEGDDGDDLGIRDFRFGTKPQTLQHVAYFDEYTTWAAEVIAGGANVQTLDTTPANVALAAEVSAPPPTNEPIGPQLTFFRAETGLDLDFEIEAIHVDPGVPERALVYDDDEAGFPVGQRLISIGDIDGVPGFPASVDLYQEDDFDIRVLDANGDVTAIGITIFGNFLVPEESFKVYDTTGQLLDVVTCGLPNDEASFVFLGVVSDTPIGRVAFTEGFGDDDIAIRDFRFGVLNPIGSVTGQVLADCPTSDAGLLGVVVDVFEDGSGDLVGSDTTDVHGVYGFPELQAGEYTLTILTPLGYSIPSEELAVMVPGGTSIIANFVLTCQGSTGDVRGSGFWKHQVGVATGGNGNAQIDPATLCSYLDLIEAHFNSNALNQVVVYDPPASGACPDKLEVAKELLNLMGNVGMTARARQQVMSLLFNVASGALNLTEQASDDSATVSQAITYCDHLIDDPSGDHETAKDIAESLNQGNLVAAGIIPLSTANIAYRRPALVLLQNLPNPFASQTKVGFNLSVASKYTLSIYNVAGQLVRRYDGAAEPGDVSITWDARDEAGRAMKSGVYFYRVKASGSERTSRMILAR